LIRYHFELILDFATCPTDKQDKVFAFQTNQYSEWRLRSGWLPCLREENDPPPERLLQAIWFHQRLHRDRLRMPGGQRVQVLHPGFWNREAGPDFRGAVVQIGDEPPRTGDVEIDLQGADWRAHGHDTNPNFANVVLHVVWQGETSPHFPTVALKPVIDSPLTELAQWLGSDSAKSFPMELRGKCCAPLRHLSANQLSDLLHQAAAIRFQAKASHLQARAKQAGWEQALWEGLFRALGYKQNFWPMQRLGELRGPICDGGATPSVLGLQARLLGVGGLLPDELPRPQSTNGSYVRRLWDAWWREREAFCGWALPRALWKFSGLRPANHPQRRLALAAHWLADRQLLTRLEAWCIRKPDNAGHHFALLEALRTGKDEFWSQHWTLRSRRFNKSQPLLGAARVTDLAINVILPWLWIRAVEGKNLQLRDELEHRYFSWPAAEDNAVLRLARQRLLGGASARAVAGAAAQQGLLQIVRDFCEHSDSMCAQCQFPEMVKQLGGN
jgi:hypothetical protein